MLVPDFSVVMVLPAREIVIRLVSCGPGPVLRILILNSKVAPAICVSVRYSSKVMHFISVTSTVEMVRSCTLRPIVWSERAGESVADI